MQKTRPVFWSATYREVDLTYYERPEGMDMTIYGMTIRGAQLSWPRSRDDERHCLMRPPPSSRIPPSLYHDVLLSAVVQARDSEQKKLTAFDGLEISPR